MLNILTAKCCKYHDRCSLLACCDREQKSADLGYPGFSYKAISPMSFFRLTNLLDVHDSIRFSEETNRECFRRIRHVCLVLVLHQILGIDLDGLYILLTSDLNLVNRLYNLVQNLNIWKWSQKPQKDFRLVLTTLPLIWCIVQSYHSGSTFSSDRLSRKIFLKIVKIHRIGTHQPKRFLWARFHGSSDTRDFLFGSEYVYYQEQQPRRTIQRETASI